LGHETPADEAPEFKGDFVFTDGSKQSPTSTASCTK
jgi:hypothetical protein